MAEGVMYAQTSVRMLKLRVLAFVDLGLRVTSICLMQPCGLF